MEARGVKIWWDDRPDLPDWRKYSREATLEEHAAKHGIGEGFHECLNFAFNHPDNRPNIKLYLPPGYKPAAANPLLLFATYVGQKSNMAGHWIGAAAAASILPKSGEREHYLSTERKKEALSFAAQADPDLVTPFVVPVPIDVRRHLGGNRWFRKPVTIPSPGRILKEAASLAAKRLSLAHVAAERKAIVRQLGVVEHILGELEREEAPASSLDHQKNKKKRPGSSGWHPDKELGTLAELKVLEDQERLLKVLRKKYSDCPEHPRHVASENPFADHDIESAMEVGHTWVRLLIEVKGTRSKDWATVMISEGQVARAQESQENPCHRFAIVEFLEGVEKSEKSTVLYRSLSELEAQFSFLPLKYRLEKR